MASSNETNHSKIIKQKPSPPSAVVRLIVPTAVVAMVCLTLDMIWLLITGSYGDQNGSGVLRGAAQIPFDSFPVHFSEQRTTIARLAAYAQTPPDFAVALALVAFLMFYFVSIYIDYRDMEEDPAHIDEKPKTM